MTRIDTVLKTWDTEIIDHTIDKAPYRLDSLMNGHGTDMDNYRPTLQTVYAQYRILLSILAAKT